MKDRAPAVKPQRRVKRVTAHPTAGPAPSDPTAWALKIVVEEDDESFSRRFTVWIAPASDVGYHLCLGSGPTRAAAMTDAETELRGALMLLGKDHRTPCENCGWRPQLVSGGDTQEKAE